MAAPDLPNEATAPRSSADRWRRRSRTLRWLRIGVPALIVLILAAMAGSVAWNALRTKPQASGDPDAPIRLVNPRFVGRDDRGRAFVITAGSATRAQNDYQRVILDRPALVLDEEGPDPMRISAASGVYHEGDRKLELKGGVRISSAQQSFETAESLFDTKTGELVGSGPIQGSGSLGEINAKSYAVYGKGERMVFKGGVRARVQMK
ncbi:LPS export ABC transporter periplasmic protein LptC [Phenylobacterium sp.]|jgi:lipopolysaccharide export system protein LptC|uniref:LPS export ABC transporter periplasmic protein LptC n=1 Tax=Phenylobacterium sp. TaxID=1871053 RepID=UPI002F9332D4